MGFFKNVGKALGKVGKAVGNVAKGAVGAVANVANGLVKAIPGVGQVYSAVTNIVGKDLGDLGNLVSSIGTGKKSTGLDSANAEVIHESLQLDSGKTTGFAVYDQNNNLVSYNGVPVYDGMYYTPTRQEASYDSNPLLLPATMQSGATNQAMINALLASGINPAAVQEALTGTVPQGNTANLIPLLDVVGTQAGQTALTPAMVTGSVTLPAGQAEGSNNKILLIGAAVLGILGLGYFLTKK